MGLHVEEGRVKREDFYGVVEKGDGFNFFVGIDEDTGEEGGDLGVFGTEFFKEVDPRGEAAGSVDVGEETGGEVVGDEGGDLNFGVRAELVAWGVLAVGPRGCRQPVDGIKDDGGGKPRKKSFSAASRNLCSDSVLVIGLNLLQPTIRFCASSA